MNITKKLTTYAISTTLAFSAFSIAPITIQEVSAASLTQQQAIEKYNKFQASYNNHEVPIIKEFERQYDGSLAHQVVARAIWYMENGYTVYETAKYADTGKIDCSNYTKLVYGDFGINITSVSRQYNQVGTKVAGVSSTIVGKSASGQTLYGIKGIENLRPGDILTYWGGTADNKYISHVAIYLGVINGKPAVINTVKDRPTALGIVNNFSFYYGEKFLEARRVLPSDAWNPAAGSKYSATSPVIPTSYVLPPQKPIIMPNNTVLNNTSTNTSPTTTNSNTTAMIVSGNTVNIRSGAGTNFSIIGTLKNGDIIQALSNTNGWVSFRTTSGTLGYVSSSLVKVHVENTTSPTTSSSTTDTTSSVLVSQVTGTSVNVRASASTTSTILGVVRKGDDVVVTRQLSGWYEIDWNGNKGFISSSLVSTPQVKQIQSSSNATQKATVIGTIVNVRIGAGRNFGVIGTITKGQVVEVVSLENEWVQIKFGAQTGYVANFLLSM
ncbi:SH3 domain-containing protein [Desulfuribacillus stibiiarsenatis]|nr:SH3 domain-containing protein [Desulfuribacillus stibiiarsenatis]